VERLLRASPKPVLQQGGDDEQPWDSKLKTAKLPAFDKSESLRSQAVKVLDYLGDAGFPEECIREPVDVKLLDVHSVRGVLACGQCFRRRGALL
jgi:hypothetical protein